MTIQGARQCIGDGQALDALAQQFLHQQHGAGGDEQGDHEIDGQRLDVDARSRVIEVPTLQWRTRQQRAQAHALERQGQPATAKPRAAPSARSAATQVRTPSEERPMPIRATSSITVTTARTTALVKIREVGSRVNGKGIRMPKARRRL